MRGRDLDLNWNNMEELEMPRGRYEEMSVSITEKGSISLNGKLGNQVLTDRKGRLDMRLAEDDRVVALKKNENGKIKMPSGARLKHEEFAERIRNRGYALPAKYIVEWNPKMECWVGVLQEVAAAPVVHRRRKKSED